MTFLLRFFISTHILICVTTSVSWRITLGDDNSPIESNGFAPKLAQIAAETSFDFSLSQMCCMIFLLFSILQGQQTSQDRSSYNENQIVSLH